MSACVCELRDARLQELVLRTLCAFYGGICVQHVRKTSRGQGFDMFCWATQFLRKVGMSTAGSSPQVQGFLASGSDSLAC